MDGDWRPAVTWRCHHLWLALGSVLHRELGSRYQGNLIASTPFRTHCHTPLQLLTISPHLFLLLFTRPTLPEANQHTSHTSRPPRSNKLQQPTANLFFIIHHRRKSHQRNLYNRSPGHIKMWGWFGGGAAAKKDAPKKAILQLRGQLEMLSKREKHLQNQMDEQDTLARKYVNTNKNGELVSTVLGLKKSGRRTYAFNAQERDC